MASFSDQIGNAVLKINTAHDKIVRTATLELFSGVIRSTPVGNPSLWKNPPPPGYVGGRARGSWQCSVASPKAGQIDRIDPSGAGTIADMQSSVPSGAGQVAYLSSNLIYIERLEFGWSTQAPAGMVRLNMDRVQRMVDTVIRKNKV